MNLLLLALLFAPPQDPTVPVGAHQVQQVQGRGVQVYRCEAQGWTLVGPDAKLYTSADPAAAVAGTHAAGPVWTWTDGSAVRGKAVEKLAAPDGVSVPWLLLKAAPASQTRGVLSPVAWVRRSDTHGGAAPATCDPARDTEPLRVPYIATYTFYTAP